MKSYRLFFFLGILTAALASAADSVPSQAVVVALKGQATGSPDGVKPSAPIQMGEVFSASGQIRTSPGGEVSLRFFDGTVTVVQPDSNVTITTLATTGDASGQKEVTLLSLQKGSLVATLDPAKKNITDFKVRTPKGVAAARGTVFAVVVNQDQSDATVATMSGTVTFVTDQGSFTIALGNVATGGGTGVMTVAQAIAAHPSLAADFVAAATSVATTIGQGGINGNGGTAGQVNSVLAAVTQIATQAAPNQAADIARNVLNAAAPGLGANGAVAAQIITQAAVSGVTKSDPALASSAATEVANSVSAAATANNITVDKSTLNSLAQTSSTPGASTTQSQQILPPLDQTQQVISKP